MEHTDGADGTRDGAGETVRVAGRLPLRHLDRGDRHGAVVDLLLPVDMPGDLLGGRGEMRVEDGTETVPLVAVHALPEDLRLQSLQRLGRRARGLDGVGALAPKEGVRPGAQHILHPADEPVVEVLDAGFVRLRRLALVEREQRVARLCELRAGALLTVAEQGAVVRCRHARSRSVTGFFSRAFSCLSCFSGRTSSAWNPNRLLQA